MWLFLFEDKLKVNIWNWKECFFNIGNWKVQYVLKRNNWKVLFVLNTWNKLILKEVGNCLCKTATEILCFQKSKSRPYSKSAYYISNTTISTNQIRVTPACLKLEAPVWSALVRQLFTALCAFLTHPTPVSAFSILHRFFIDLSTLVSKFSSSQCRDATTQESVGPEAPCYKFAKHITQTTIFSPEGRLYQVEYALEAISLAGTAIGILANDGIVLAAERKVTSKLLEQDTSAEKLYILNE